MSTAQKKKSYYLSAEESSALEDLYVTQEVFLASCFFPQEKEKETLEQVYDIQRNFNLYYQASIFKSLKPEDDTKRFEATDRVRSFFHQHQLSAPKTPLQVRVSFLNRRLYLLL